MQRLLTLQDYQCKNRPFHFAKLCEIKIKVFSNLAMFLLIVAIIIAAAPDPSRGSKPRFAPLPAVQYSHLSCQWLPWGSLALKVWCPHNALAYPPHAHVKQDLHLQEVKNFWSCKYSGKKLSWFEKPENWVHWMKACCQCCSLQWHSDYWVIVLGDYPRI